MGLLALLVLGGLASWRGLTLTGQPRTGAALGRHSTAAQRLAFERRAAAAEVAAQHDPSGYRRRVVAFALLGYAVLWFVLILLLGLAGIAVMGAVTSAGVLVFLIKTKLGIAVVVGIAILLRALWVKFEPPRGLRIDLAAVPKLREEIERLRTATRAPVVHEVVLTPEFNAAMVQTPRLGVFGWQRNSLVLGVQLLLALSPDQCSAVIAHELAHLSSGHARLSGWIYRVREGWRRTMFAFEESGSSGTRLLAGFFHWYAPAFAAYSFALARRNEFEADALAARATTNVALGEGLVRARVLIEAIDRIYWREIDERADHQANPERQTVSGLLRFFTEAFPGRETIEPILRRALTEESGFAGTHPSLHDRLAALGVSAEVPAPIVRPGARAWLDERLDEALDAFDAQWLQINATTWRNRFREAQTSRATFATLRERAEESLTRHEHWLLATLAERFERDRDPLSAYLAFNARFPDDHQASFAIGRLLAERDDPWCIAHLEFSRKLPSLARPSAEIALQYLLRAGENQSAEIWRRRAEDAYDIECIATRERQSVAKDDTYLDPQLPASVLEEIRAQVASVPGIKRAWLARKRTEYFPEHPVYVLAFEARGWRPNERQIIETLTRVLTVPGQTFLVRSGGKTNAVARMVIKRGVVVLP